MTKTNEEEIYLEEKRLEFEAILESKDWGQIGKLYVEMENSGYDKYVPELSELMSEEDVKEYKEWDKRVNGDVETQMDDDS